MSVPFNPKFRKLGSRGRRPGINLRNTLPFFLSICLPLSVSGKERPLRALMGLQGYAWVDDAAKLDEKLRIAGSWGYNAFIYSFNAPALVSPQGDTNWFRDSSSQYRWTLSDGTRKGHANARAAFTAGIRSIQAAVEKRGFEFIPTFGPWGWGNTLTEIDPATAAGAYYDIRITDASAEWFRLKSPHGARGIDTTAGWGDPAHVDLRFASDGRLDSGSIRLPETGMHAAQFTFMPARDAYWRLQMDVAGDAGTRGGVDSAYLKVYDFHEAKTHPFSTKLVAQDGIPLRRDPSGLSVGFFTKAGAAFLIDLELHMRSGAAGGLRLKAATLHPIMPPRKTLINSSEYEAQGKGGLSFLDRMVRAGELSESEGYTMVDSRRRGWKDARFFQLDPQVREAAWDSLDGIKGEFADQACDGARKSVDPLAPATMQIFSEVVRALTEAMPAKPNHFLLGGDEIFNWSSRRYARPPYSGMDHGQLLAKIMLTRLKEVDSSFASRFPADSSEMDFILFGDMFTNLHGLGDMTLSARKALATSGLGNGRILIAPWYYDSHIRQAEPFYHRFGFPDSLPYLEKFKRLIRWEVGGVAGDGLDFLGLYSTDGREPPLADEVGGARAWADVCSEYAATVNGQLRGRCRGMIYAGWDTGRQDWGNGYDGLIPLARFGWIAPSKSLPPSLAADADKDGVLDALETKRLGPLGPYGARPAESTPVSRSRIEP